MSRKFLVSTDISGIFGSRADWEYVWADLIKDKNFSGFEMIGWKWGDKFIGPRYKNRVTGIHGATAGWSEGREIVGKTMLWALNYLFFDFSSLIKRASSVNYILIHRGAISRKVDQDLFENKNKINLLCVENDLVPNAFSKTIQKIEELRGKGINAGLMFDLVHFLREPEKDAPDIRRWDLLISAIKEIKKLNFPVNFHFPIGSYENDSLPLSKITDDMWSELSAALRSVNYQYLVLENQAPRRYSLFLTRANKLHFRDRTSEVYSLLKKHKII